VIGEQYYLILANCLSWLYDTKPTAIYKIVANEHKTIRKKADVSILYVLFVSLQSLRTINKKICIAIATEKKILVYFDITLPIILEESPHVSGDIA
jgi:hypothetical protein